MRSNFKTKIVHCGAMPCSKSCDSCFKSHYTITHNIIITRNRYLYYIL